MNRLGEQLTQSVGLRVAACVAAVAFAGGCNRSVDADPISTPETGHSTADSHAPTSTTPHPIEHAKTLANRHFTVYTAVVNADGHLAPGFRPVAEKPEKLAATVLQGWNMLRTAANQVLPPATVDVGPSLAVTTPNVLSAADLCTDAGSDGLRTTLLAMARQETADTNASAETSPDVPVFFLQIDPRKLAPKCDLTAVGGPVNGIVVYDTQRYHQPILFAHEGGHVERADHDGAIVNCAMPRRVDTTCQIKDYGNTGTYMGDQWSYDKTHDPDALTAYTMRMLDAITPEQIVTVPVGNTQTLELSPVAKKDHAVKAIRIPIGSLADEQGVSGLKCATAVYIELDHTTTINSFGDVIGHPYGLSVYTVNERPVPDDQFFSTTALVPFGPNDYTLTFKDGAASLTLGNTKLRLSLSLHKGVPIVRVSTSDSRPLPTPTSC